MDTQPSTSYVNKHDDHDEMHEDDEQAKGMHSGMQSMHEGAKPGVKNEHMEFNRVIDVDEICDDVAGELDDHGKYKMALIKHMMTRNKGKATTSE